MYCEVYGKGEPLLIIHGDGGSISTFKNNIPYFSGRYMVIVADSRSSGKSIDNNDSLSFEMMADDYADLLDSLRVASTNVFGWSDGGNIGILMAIRHPQKVSKLAVSGANLWPGETAIQADKWESDIEERIKLASIPTKTAAEEVKLKLSDLDMKQPNISTSQLHTISCPTLIIAGDNDIIRRKHTKTIHENVKNASLWMVSHSGHYTLNRINNRVDEFLSNPFRQ
jgi:pimeloyl-ACP methyl ester carboxylesterase